MKKVYVDSCVYISFLTNEMNYAGQLRGNYLYVIFEKFWNKELKLVISTWVIKEVKKKLRHKFGEDGVEMFENLIKDLKNINNLEIVRYNDIDIKDANELDSDNFPDALHAVLAKKSNSDILTTENVKDFKDYKIIKVLHPRDLIKSDFF